MGEDSIRKFFREKTIFVTGGTGFIGKALIEKLLRTCPDLKKIYILIRPKKGKEPLERVQQITSSSLFSVLKQKHPENIEKIIPICGDTSEIGLGISEKDRQILIDEVQIYFHAAASVRFDDFLKDAIITNIRSAREAALLALDMKKIEVFEHVSTTYCNIDNRKVVEPKLYPPHGHWKELIMVAEKCDVDTLNILSEKYRGDFPNTYTFTKQLAEHCINDLLGEKVPTVLFRPSVVVSAITEPFTGWIDNFNGPLGLLTASASGLLRTFYGDQDIVTDFIPVDNIVKCMIVTVWHKVYHGKKHELEVYNGSNMKQMPLTMRTMLEIGKETYWEIPFSRKFWFPRVIVTKNWYIYFFRVLLFHMIPAVFIDLLLRAAGKKPMVFKLQRTVYIACMATSYFALNEWRFVNTNTLALLDYIPRAEKEDFEFNTAPNSEAKVKQYFKTSCNVARQILMKEDEEITEKTRVMTTRLYYLDRACHWMFYAGTFWLIFFKINILTLIWNFIFNYWESL